MAWDIIRPRGTPKAYKSDSGGAVLRELTYFGVVKDNIDPARIGRLRVYISAVGAGQDPDDPSNWTTVNYMSPFYGATQPNGPSGTDNWGTFLTNSHSYGMWNSPPDIGTVVICLFVNGDPNYGFYIGAAPEPEALHMVPAIGASKDIVLSNSAEGSSYGGAPRLPVVNVNSDNNSIYNSIRYFDEPKPVHSYQASIYFNQGLLRDPIRGPISSNAQRESPSRVGWGVSSPGRPIYEGGYTDTTIAGALNETNSEKLQLVGRRGGHSIVLDDGDLIGRDQLVRIRTAMGHQILMSDDGQTLFIIHSNGKSYIELGKEGTIDMYSTNSVNIRTQGDLNLHADQDVNIHAGRDINMRSEGTTKLNSVGDIETHTTGRMVSYAAGNYTVKSDASISLDSAADASLASGGTAFVNGSKVHLNTGAIGVVPIVPDIIKVKKHTDTAWSDSKGFVAAPGKLDSITSRAPAHTPWASAGFGVDAKVTLNAAGAMPSAPSTEVQRATDSANDGLPVSQGVVNSVTQTAPATPSLDVASTNASLSAVATTAATGPTADAVKRGAAIVTGTDGVKNLAVGSFAATPQILEKTGGIKPGSAPLVSALAQKAGATPSTALPSSLFTGNAGKNLEQFTGNQSAQIKTAVGAIGQAQNGLKAAGTLSGKENPSGIVGMLVSGATAGVGKTVEFVKGIGSGVSGLFGKVSSLVSTGSSATNIAQNVSGPLGSIADSVKGGINPAKGASASAFDSIVNSLPTLKVGVPVDVEKAAKQASATPTVGKNFADSVSSGMSTLKGGIASAAGVVGGGISGITGKISSLTSGNVTAATPSFGQGLSLNTALSQATKNLPSASSLPSVNALMSSFPGGKAPSLPQLAVNTDDVKASVEAKARGLVGEKTPAPMYGNESTLGNSGAETEYEQQQQETEAKEDEYTKALTEYTAALMESSDALIALGEAQQQYEMGDPRIDALQQEYDRLLARATELSSRVEEISASNTA